MKLSSSSTYLKADNVKKGDIVKFLDEGSIETSEKYTYDDGTPKKNLVFLVEFKGQKTKLRLNKGSKDACIQAFSDETKAWIGREASIYLMPLPSGKKSIILEPIFKDGVDAEWDK